MSDPQITIPLADFEALATAVSDLSSVIQRIRDSQPCALDYPGWEGFTDPYLVVGFPSVSALETIGGYYHTVEEGPPELPQSCLDLALVSLSHTVTPEIRALRAFRLGFWDKSSLLCSIPQLPSTELPVDLPDWHWIALKTKDWALPVRFGSLSDFERFCNQETVEIHQTFSSLAELEIYCVGAAIKVPTLIRWRNPR